MSAISIVLLNEYTLIPSMIIIIVCKTSKNRFTVTVSDILDLKGGGEGGGPIETHPVFI